jgi:protein TonB
MRSEAALQGSRVLVRLVFLFVLLTVPLLGFPASAQAAIEASRGPAIISPTHPKDSRGEVVYETQGESQKDQPVVPGVLTQPSPVRTPPPKYPKSLKKAHAAGDVTVSVVITQDGDVIDATVLDSPNPESSSFALNTIKKYRFKPATLDGKPVAMLAKFVIDFRIWSPD